MGTWGTAISSNDAYADAYSEFFELYNDGLEVAEISKRLIEKNQKTINDTDDCNNFWFALAKAQWECNQLDKELYNRVKNIIDTGADIEVWRQLDSEEKELNKRKLVLDKFLADISTDRAKAKSRKKKRIIQPLFEKGACLTFQFANGNYGGAVVLEEVKDTELGPNLLVKVIINQQTKPLLEDFKRTNVLIKSFGSWKDEPDIGWCYATSFIRSKVNIEIVGKLDIDINYDPKDYSSKFYYGGSDEDLVTIPVLQLEFEKANGKPSKTITIKKMTKKNKWKLW